MSILFLNHSKQQCGVYQYGKRLFEILQKTGQYRYAEIETVEEYQRAITYKPATIVYNYHQSTMPWLNRVTIQTEVMNIGIPHESPDHLFDIVVDIDPTAPESANRFSIPRPIYEKVDELLETYTPSPNIKEFIEYSREGVPVFGSFGFGFLNKGFYRLVRLIDATHDAAIIKLIIPSAHFDPNRDHTTNTMRQICENLPRKQSIQLMITHEFVSNEDLLLFLRSNTMNLFLYDKLEGRGISSAIDYALSVETPLAISDSHMFRHIYSDEICAYKRPLVECIKHSRAHCVTFLQRYSHEALLAKMDKICRINLKTK
jgi:hypothetical protein